MDLVGPLPPSRGKRFVVTIIDRTSHWPVAVPVADISAEKIAEVFATHWISSFGVQSRITTDQGRQFESDLFSSLCRTFGCQRIRTTAYHPQANGRVERWHRALKSAILANQTLDWVGILSLVLLDLRSSVRDTGVSAAQLTLGTELRLSGDLIVDSVFPMEKPHAFV